jgi:hypothetical protein
MPKTRWIAAALCALALGGCAKRETFAYKAGATDADWRRDDYECRRENSMVVVDRYAYVTESRLAVDRAMYVRCLEARGWQIEVGRKDEPATPVPGGPAPRPSCGRGKYWSTASKECRPNSEIQACGVGFYWDTSSRQCEKVGIPGR